MSWFQLGTAAIVAALLMAVAAVALEAKGQRNLALVPGLGVIAAFLLLLVSIVMDITEQRTLDQQRRDANARAAQELPVLQYREWLSRAQVLEDRKVLRVPAVAGDVAPRPDFLDRLIAAGWVYDGRRESFDYFVPGDPDGADAAVITIKSILSSARKP